MTEASHPIGHINGVYNEKDKSNHVYEVKRLRVAKLELFLLDHIAIKVYEFVLWWPVWVLKKHPNRPPETELPSSTGILKCWRPLVLMGRV